MDRLFENQEAHRSRSSIALSHFFSERDQPSEQEVVAGELTSSHPLPEELFPTS